jgi:hypothetical protein
MSYILKKYHFIASIIYPTTYTEVKGEQNE